MSELKILKKIQLCSSPLTKVIQNPYNLKQLISTSLNGRIHIWKLPKLESAKQIDFKYAKLTYLVPFINSKFKGFLMAIRNGQLAIMNEDFEIKTFIRLHKQCISEIIISSSFVITVSYDGYIFFLDKQTFLKSHQMNLENPLFSALQYNRNLYVASIKSFVVNLDTFSVKQMQRYNNFILVNNEIFGCSDDRGLCCLNYNSNNYIPAEFILPYNREILIFSERSICVANPSKKLTYKAKKYSQLSSGQTITTGFTCQNNVYIGGNQGNLYWISEGKQG